MLISSYRLRLLLGVVGSVCLTLGTLGVGWLAPGSVLRTWAFFDVIRNSRAGVGFCMALVIAGVLLLLVSWLALGLSLRMHDRDRRPNALRQVVTSAVAWSIPLLVAFPLFSRDIFAYLGQGRLMAAGLNPYTHSMSEVPGWYELGIDEKWSTTLTPYGPLFILALKVIAGAGLPIELALLATRLLAVAGFAMLAYYAWRIARLRGFHEPAVLWVVAASPLVLMNFVVAGHNDALMLGFIVAGTYWALRDRPLLATALVVVAIGVKPIAVLALPVIGIIWAGSNASWSALIRRWLVVGALALGAVVALGLGLGVGLGWIGALGTPLTIASWYSPVRQIGLFVTGLAGQPWNSGQGAYALVILVFLIIGGAAVTYLFTVKRRSDPLWLLAGAFAVVALASPLLHPWYGLWLISLFAIAGLGRVWQVRTLIYGTAFLMGVGFQDQLDLIDRLRPDTLFSDGYLVTAAAGIVVAVAVFEIVLWKRITSRGLPFPMLGRPADVGAISVPSTPSR